MPVQYEQTQDLNRPRLTNSLLLNTFDELKDTAQHVCMMYWMSHMHDDVRSQ